jgi:hypothetical protein
MGSPACGLERFMGTAGRRGMFAPWLTGIDQLRLLPTAFSRMAQASSPYFFFHSA